MHVCTETEKAKNQVNSSQDGLYAPKQQATDGKAGYVGKRAVNAPKTDCIQADENGLETHKTGLPKTCASYDVTQISGVVIFLFCLGKTTFWILYA